MNNFELRVFCQTLLLFLLRLKRQSGTTNDVSTNSEGHQAYDVTPTAAKIMPYDKSARNNAPFRDVEDFHDGPVVNADVSLAHSSVEIRVQPAQPSKFMKKHKL